MRTVCISILAVVATIAGRAVLASPPGPSSDSFPTFDRNIAPIVYAHCSACHRADQASPFQLISYAEVKARGQQIAQVTRSGLMPPWKAGDGDCPLKDVNRLTSKQLDCVEKWVATGMREGSPGDLPPKPNFVDGWLLGKPDLIVKMPRPYHIRPEGPDIYRTFAIPLNLTEDKWVTAIEFHPSARRAVHHSLFFFDATGQTRAFEDPTGEPGSPGAGPRGAFGEGTSDKGGGPVIGGLGGDGASSAAPGDDRVGSLGGWAVGASPNRLPDGLAYRVPKGSDLVLADHFHMTGKQEIEQTEVGLYFAKRPPDRQFTTLQLPPAFGFIKGIDIAPGDKDWELTDTFTLPVDIQGFEIAGHAHNICTKMLMTATLPDGTRKTLLTIPKWDFAWQQQYQYMRFEPLPKGTRLDVSIHYDNSADNPYNPFSPPRRMLWGPQTINEMGSVTLMAIAANDADTPTLRQAYRDHIREQFEARFGKLERLMRRGGSKARGAGSQATPSEDH